MGPPPLQQEEDAKKTPCVFTNLQLISTVKTCGFCNFLLIFCIVNTGYKTDHRAVLAFTDQCTSGGTGPYRSALVRTGQHWSVYTREASEIFKLSGC